MQTLRIGGVPEHFNYPWHYAIEEGLFFDADISVQWTDYPGGTGSMVTDLREGKLDMALLLTEGAVNAISSGLNAKVLQFYVQSPLVWGIHTKAGEALKMEDLKGKRYAISRKGSGSHLMAIVDAEKREWDSSKLNFVEVGSLGGAIEAITEGTADVFLWEKFTTKPYVDKGIFQLVDERPTPWPAFTLVVRKEIMINRPKTIELLQKTIIQSIKTVQKKKDLAEILSNRYHIASEDIQKWLKITKWGTQNSVKYASLKSVAQTLYDLKLIQHIPTEQDLFS